MISAVLDTNVLVVGFLNRDSTPGQLIHAWRSGFYHLISSEHIVSELIRTFTDDYFRKRLTQDQIDRAVILVRNEAIVIPITVVVTGVATHPEDDDILATAVSGKAEYLVTGDRQLQKLNSYRDVAILSPAAFLSLLKQEQAA